MKSRNQSLDVLRGVAILLVLGNHFWYPWIFAWNRVGWVGVDLFFILSGFLISGLLFREFASTGAIDLGRFALRRGLKIWPAFYAFLIVVGFLSSRVFPGMLTGRSILKASLFLGNYYPIEPWVFFSHIWSLAVEEHFYILLPLLLAGLVKYRKSATDPFDVIPSLALGLIALCLLLRLLFVKPGTLAWATHLRLDSLFAGVALGYLYHFRPARFAWFTGQWSALIAALCVLPCAIWPAQNRFVQTFGLTLLLIGFSFLVANGVAQRPGTRAAKAACAALARLGFYSYSVYLWHWPVAFLFNVAFRNSGLAFALSAIFAVLLGIGMSKLIEMPMLAVRERIAPQFTTVNALLSPPLAGEPPMIVNACVPTRLCASTTLIVKL